METNFVLAYSSLEPVVKSERRVPIAMIRSASLAMVFAARLPVTPTPPKFMGWLELQADLPAWVSLKGIWKVSQNFSKVLPASL